MLMGVINAVFAPFIVLYLLMYSFFRYFEVRTASCLAKKKKRKKKESGSRDGSCRSITRIHPRSARVNSLSWPVGSFENSTSCRTIFNNVSITRTQSLINTSTSFQKRRRRSYPALSRSWPDHSLPSSFCFRSSTRTRSFISRSRPVAPFCSILV